jgi:uncharacterized membrane protein HdeD (DUF308 family)
MDIVIKILGIVFVIMAVVCLLKPDVMKKIIEIFRGGNRIYIAGLLRLILAVVFLLSARECRHFWVIFIFGILFLISGLLIFIIGAERLRPMFGWIQNRSAVFLRVMAAIILAVGAVIIYSA